MFQRISSAIKGLFACTALLTSTLVIFSILIPIILIKVMLPFKPARVVIDFVLNGLASIWVAINGLWMAGVSRTRWHLKGFEGFNAKGWYLVSSNHQSWVDILVLQKVFNYRIPFLKFFIKQELIYVPIMGLVWWALDFPFMARKGGASAAKDLETARKACEKYRFIPTSVISFMEGTRFTPAKALAQKSSYKNLLKPKTGGVGVALDTMGELFDALLDVTIVYPHGVPTFIDLLTGQIDDVIVSVRQVPIPKHLLADEKGETPRRALLQTWVNEIWQAKDADIDQLMAQFKAGQI